MTHAAENLDAVFLDLHARAAAVAFLPPPKLLIDLLNFDRQAGRQTFNYRDQCASMRFSGSGEAKHFVSQWSVVSLYFVLRALYFDV